MKYPRYPTYKESGAEWIGEIPEHWDVKRLKFVSKIQFSNVDKHSFDSEMPVLLANYTDVYKNQFITTEMEFMEATASLNEIKKFHLEAGDILVTKDSETPDDIAIPALVKNTLPNLLCGYHLAMLKPNSHSLDSNYLFYLYSDKKFRGKYESEANGITRFGLSQESFSDTFICIPDISEQRTISLFLEEQTSKIDYLISKTQIMINLLKEKRQAIITNAVTKGLDPNVPMKDSGVEWIGEIPEHWEIKPLFSLMRESKTKNTEDENLEVLSLSYGNIIIRDVDNNFGLLPESFATYQVVDKGNIILRLTDLQNDKKSLRVGLVKKRGIITSAYVCLQTSVDLIPEFAYFMLHSYDIRKVFYGFGGGVRQSMTFKDLKHLPLVYPSTDEQIQIIEHIKTEIDKLDILILKQEKVIELLREYRTSLISHAVTGKIDVRSFAVPINLNSTRT